MTVIAWDGSTLAADRRAIIGGGLRRTTTKIWREQGILLGVTGALETALEVVEWFKSGADPASFPSAARGDVCTLIVVDADGVRTYTTGPFPVWVESERCAFGSGRDYAEAAMYLGHDARKAVEVASVFQTDCGDGCDYLHLITEYDLHPTESRLRQLTQA